jgi:hypothetical protein
MPSVLQHSLTCDDFARRPMRNLPGPKPAKRSPTALFATTAIKRMANTSKAGKALVFV